MSFLASIALGNLENLEDRFVAVVSILISKKIFTLDEFDGAVADVKRAREEKKKGTS